MLRGLRAARRRSGLSIGQLADLTGIRRETITHLEHQQTEAQPYMLRRLVAALDTSADALHGLPVANEGDQTLLRVS